jgi:hypothetical protein
MKKNLINYIQRPKFDELYTPPEAVLPILPYLPKGKIYWECTDYGDSNITRLLKENGYNVISTHLNTNFNFLIDAPDFEYDIILTNPPYSLKTDFLKRAYELGKPFGFLLPLTALEGVERGKLYREYGVEVLVLDRRINYMKDKKGAWFNSSWFCWQLLPNKLIHAQLR